MLYIYVAIYIYVVINTKKYGSENVGLCRGDGLNIFRNASGLELEKIKKQKQK